MQESSSCCDLVLVFVIINRDTESPGMMPGFRDQDIQTASLNTYCAGYRLLFYLTKLKTLSIHTKINNQAFVIVVGENTNHGARHYH
jgi:hypothetical protein